MNNRKEHYNKKGMYNGYDKNHKEREALDYYSTPTEEVTNILNILNINFIGKTILEPAAGGGHMLQGIKNYLADNINNATIIATDIQDRGCNDIETGTAFDFLSDEYPYKDNIDYIIMNPPYSIIEPFVMRSLGIANKGILMLGRLQFLEGEKRFENILAEYPPTDIYVYVDRIACFKNGDISQKMSSAQAYAWFYWDIEKVNTTIYNSKIHWLRRADKI